MVDVIGFIIEEHKGKQANVTLFSDQAWDSEDWSDALKDFFNFQEGASYTPKFDVGVASEEVEKSAVLPEENGEEQAEFTHEAQTLNLRNAIDGLLDLRMELEDSYSLGQQSPRSVTIEAAIVPVVLQILRNQLGTQVLAEHLEETFRKLTGHDY